MTILKQVRNFFGSLYARLRGRKPTPPSKLVDPYTYREPSVSQPWTPPKKFGSVPSAPKPIRVTGDFMVGRPMREEQTPKDTTHRASVHNTREFEESVTDSAIATAAIASLISSVETIEQFRHESEPAPIESGGSGSFAGGGADASWNDSSSSSDNDFSND